MEIYYYGEVGKDLYPDNPQKLGFSAEKMKLDYLTKTDKELPEDWQCPETWEEFNKSDAPILFLRSPKETYFGKNDIPVFITKPTHRAIKWTVCVTYEDGRIEAISLKEASKLLKEAGLQNK